MSRVGKVPIPLPKGVEVKVAPTSISVKGPLGSMSLEHHARVDIAQEDGNLVVRRFDDSHQSRAFHGLYQRLLSNMVTGVTKGFSKELEIQGIGYKVAMQGKALLLNLGYSHQITFPPPEGITLEAPKPTSIIIKGADKQKVGQVAAEIRGLRPPDAYKGKGIRHLGERVILKEGKKAGK